MDCCVPLSRGMLSISERKYLKFVFAKRTFEEAN
jgi:hypothetical protein